MAEGRRSNGAGAPPADALKDAGQRLLDLLVQRSAEAATQRVNGLTVRLSDVTDSGGDLRAALRRNPEKDGQASRPGGLRGTLSAAWRRALSGLQDKMQNIFGGGRGAEQLTRINLLEGVEVGLPLRTTYDAWTQFADFPASTGSKRSGQPLIRRRTGHRSCGGPTSRGRRRSSNRCRTPASCGAPPARTARWTAR